MGKANVVESLGSELSLKFSILLVDTALLCSTVFCRQKFCVIP